MVADESPTMSYPSAEEHPDYGVIAHSEYGIELCAIEHWVEDGLHVIRAADFDLIALDEDHDKAACKFVEEVFSLVGALHELVMHGEPTPSERELWVLLATPILEAGNRDQEAAEQKRARRLIDFPRFRRPRGDHSPAWRQSSGPGKLNQPSTA